MRNIRRPDLSNSEERLVIESEVSRIDRRQSKTMDDRDKLSEQESNSIRAQRDRSNSYRAPSGARSSISAGSSPNHSFVSR